jgi:putative ABC transport system ATP-binding protein
MELITAEKLTKSYGTGEARIKALKDVSLKIDSGDFVALMGPSGSGKSTLLSILGALNTPDVGRYMVDDINVYELDRDRRADFRREYLGFVFQDFHLVPYLSLRENVMLPLTTKKLPSKEKRDMAQDALERVGLGEKAGRLPSQVSGGEQERCAVARAIVNQPPIILADEPTGNLDAANGLAVMGLLRDLAEDGVTVIMVTHSREFASYADRIMSVADGRLI